MFKTKGGGSTAVWTMFKKTADLVLGGTPNEEGRWGLEMLKSGWHNMWTAHNMWQYVIVNSP